MAGPLLLGDNLYNGLLYPVHTITADEEATGHEIAYLADGRRSPYDYYTSVTANAQRTLTIDCGSGVTRQVNCWFLDRGHNLAGKQVIYEDSTNGSVWNTRVTVTVPTSGTDLTSTNGAFTEEGANGKSWTTFTGTRYHRIRIPAMGAGLKPVIVGLWLGLAYQPSYLYTPWSEDGFTLSAAEQPTEWAWIGRGPVVPVREGTLSLRFDSASDYSLARPLLRDQYGRGRPMWVCYDTAQADRSFLAILPGGARVDPGFHRRNPRDVQLPYREHEPV